MFRPISDRHQSRLSRNCCHCYIGINLSFLIDILPAVLPSCMSSFFGASGQHPKRKKVISLDDLLIDYYKEKGKCIEEQAKHSKTGGGYSSEEEEVAKNEVLLSQYISECQQKMGEVNNDAECLSWGIQVFGRQKPLPVQLEFPNCEVLQSFMHSELNSSLGSENVSVDESSIQGLLVNGWLSELVLICGHVEKSIAVWTSNLLLYSPQERLRELALGFWFATLLSQSKSEFMGRLNSSGFQAMQNLETLLIIMDFSQIQTPGLNQYGQASLQMCVLDCKGPPQNIRVWIKFVSICAKERWKHSIFSSREVEEIIGYVVTMFLDRNLEGLFLLLSECLLSLISYFTDEEWGTKLTKISHSIASRVPKDLNCLRVVECISGVDPRSKQLRSEVAYKVLLECFDGQASKPEEILRLLIDINMKDKACNLLRVYIMLALSENWLLFEPLHQNKLLISEMWAAFLRNCSYQIGGVDLRPFALKVRTKAIYLLQGIGRAQGS